MNINGHVPFLINTLDIIVSGGEVNMLIKKSPRVVITDGLLQAWLWH